MPKQPPTQLVREEPAWPDAVRVPLADAAGRARLLDALNAIDGQVIANAQNPPALRELAFARGLLRDWTRLGIPQRPPRGYLGSLDAILRKYNLYDAAEEIRRRLGEEPIEPGWPCRLICLSSCAFPLHPASQA